MSQSLSGKKAFFFNLIFLLVCGGIFLFLWEAPPETTAKLPHDENHIKFYDMDKKKAETFCQACHNPDGVMPLSKEHPPKYRCLFCHKKEEQPENPAQR